jgi:hypothetical protein
MEKWKVVEGFEAYEVSDQGRIRRVLAAGGTKVGKVLRPGTDPNGRLMVALCMHGKAHTKMLHVLVAKAFVPNPKQLPEVNHLKTLRDVQAVNLEWRSKDGNEQHAVKNARKGIGVHYSNRRKHWIANYGTKWKTVYVGSFPTKREALEARRAAVKALPEII